jgi:hypothetical protein
LDCLSFGSFRFGIAGLAFASEEADFQFLLDRLRSGDVLRRAILTDL